MTPYTPEERTKALEQLTRFSPLGPSTFAEQAFEGSWLALLWDKQMRLNRLERREAEARELIDQYEALRCGRSKFYPDFHKVTAWLSEEGV